jgi:2-keto-4-pentenoate hydratase
MSVVWEDPRVCRGMAMQLNRRRERLRAGEKPLGWKLAFGAPAAMERLSISGPLVGFLMQGALLASGSALSLSDWKKPVVEPEISVRMGRDLPGGADRAAARAAIASMAPALELADVQRPQTEIEEILSGNISQRNVILGRADVSRAGGAVNGLTGRLLRNGKEVASTSDPEAMTGELIDLVRHVADYLAAFGETLLAGQIIIAGAVMPPVWVEASEEIVFTLDPIDSVSVRFAATSNT